MSDAPEQRQDGAPVFERGAAHRCRGVHVAHAFPASAGPAAKLPPDRHHVFVCFPAGWRLIDMRAVYASTLLRPPLAATLPYFEFAHRERLEAYARDLAAIGLDNLPAPAPADEPQPSRRYWLLD